MSMRTQSRLIDAIREYQTSYSGESLFIPQFLELLKHPRAFYRDHLPGHITGSSWIIDESRQYTLLTHHRKLNRWLQPGGHADGDENIIRVCTREAEEETGLKSLRLFSADIFDLDIHTIPARKDFPQHLHYDVRLLFIASADEPLIISDESNDLAWIGCDELQSRTANNISMLRMAEKVSVLFGSDQQ
jgi:8-oxo-dGTP pyrophosphatase MutT (NUDIX family)